MLFVADDPGTASEIGIRLIETMTGDETMPALRVGMAFGTVTTRMGDVFGTTVNLASRLTSIAPRDAVLVDGDFAEALAEAGRRRCPRRTWTRRTRRSTASRSSRCGAARSAASAWSNPGSSPAAADPRPQA